MTRFIESMVSCTLSRYLRVENVVIQSLGTSRNGKVHRSGNTGGKVVALCQGYVVPSVHRSPGYVLGE